MKVHIINETIFVENNDTKSHAYKINFIHPITNKKMEIVAELPTDIRKLI